MQQAGGGATVVDGEEFQWRRFEHRFDTDSTLFCMTDTPVLQAFNWVRSEDL